MISKKISHTYIADGMRYFALLCPVETENVRGKLVQACNFFIFDEEGYCWLQMTHTTQSFIYQLGNGVLQSRTILEVQDNRWVNTPIVPSDEWIDGHPDRGYALEIIREGLGLNLIYLTQLMREPTVCESQRNEKKDSSND